MAARIFSPFVGSRKSGPTRSKYISLKRLAAKEDKKQVTNIAKKTILRTLESKARMSTDLTGQTVLQGAAGNALQGPITGIPNGTQIGQRDGNKAMLTGIRMSGEIYGTTAFNGQNQIRFLVFWDNTPSASQTLADLLDTTNNAGIHIPLNWNNHKRFRIIYDRIFVHSKNNFGTTAAVPGADAYQFPQWTFKKTFRFKRPVPLNYTGTLASNIEGKHLYWLLYSNQNANLLYSINMQIRFKDS